MSAMSKFKRVARILAGAILATGIFAGTATAPASAANVDHGSNARMTLLDTGWGG
jgi:hypothetical protein